MNRRPLSAIVLAAGEGTRMRSGTPKPLHRLCGRPMVLHVLDSLAELTVERVVVVVGHGATEVTKAVQAEAPKTSRSSSSSSPNRAARETRSPSRSQASPVSSGADFDEGDMVVLPGDTPLLRPATLAALVESHRASEGAATLLTARLDHPGGYSRIVRDKDGRVARIVDEPAATEEERQIDEVATTVYCFRHGVLAPALRRLSPDNPLGEYYLTDTIAVLHDAGYAVTTLVVRDPAEAVEVNDRAQLAVAEAELRRRINERWMRRGVTMWDPERTYLDASVRLGRGGHAVARRDPRRHDDGRRRCRARSLVPPGRLRDRRRRTSEPYRRLACGDRRAMSRLGRTSFSRTGTRLACGTRRGPFFGPGIGQELSGRPVNRGREPGSRTLRSRHASSMEVAETAAGACYRPVPPGAGRGDRLPPRRRLERDQHPAIRRRRDPLPLRLVDAWR